MSAVERSDLPVGQQSKELSEVERFFEAAGAQRFPSWWTVYDAQAAGLVARVRAQVAEDLRPLITALTAVYDTYLATGGYEPTPEQIKAGMASLVPIEDSHAMEAACDAVLPHLVQLRRFLAEAAPAPAETFAAALPDVVGTRRPVEAIPVRAVPQTWSSHMGNACFAVDLPPLREGDRIAVSFDANNNVWHGRVAGVRRGVGGSMWIDAAPVGALPEDEGTRQPEARS